MKKKVWILIVVLLAFLFTPIPTARYKDGGTKVYSAVVYKIVRWNRLTDDGTYKKTRVYFGLNRFKSIDSLWYMEERNNDNVMLKHSFYATVLEINENSLIVEPFKGESERKSSDKISFSIDEDIEVKIGSVVKVTYIGGIMESYPAQVNSVKCKVITDTTHRK